MSLLLYVVLESLGRFLQKFRRHAEIDLRVPNMDMAQIDRQQVQQSLYIRPLLIPRRQTMDCKCVTQIVNSRLLSRVRAANPRRVAQNLEGCAGRCPA